MTLKDTLAGRIKSGIIMKNLSILILLVTTITSGCKNNVDFVQLMKDDFHNAVLEFPDSLVRLYEVQTRLSHPVSELVSAPGIVASSSYITIGNKVKLIDRTYKKGRISKEYEHFEEYDGHNKMVLDEDYPITIDSIKISFKEAVDILRRSKCSASDKPYMTIRKTSTSQSNPQYIFSGTTVDVAVNAETGEINIIEQ